jgi:hypothetical protein
MPSSGWAMTKHFLPGSTSAQPRLSLHSLSTATAQSRCPLLTLVLRLHPSAAQAAHPHLTRAQSQFWALTMIGYLPFAHTCRLMNLINSTRCSARALFRDPRP